ncbi:hypothetical protein VaNZ11_014925 [Volvox africanus]|uniref:Protein kinase domain-containing protein n=1 Tax=Volvox africanus TaxID=51714 RepID=A0ABQ5SKC6_9CHLO|nr:hypothetical protein VaNZ11_014925 [Volvox africanus]
MVMLCWRPASDSAFFEAEKVEAFRRKIAANAASWPSLWNVYAAEVMDTCDCTLVSVLGASQNSSTLTVLGSWGPDAATLCSGRVLPSPWKLPSGSAARQHKDSSLSPRKPTPREEAAEMPIALTWKSGSQLSLPYEWHQLLGQARFSETSVLRAHLEPLVLGSKLVGALLVVAYAGKLPHSHERLLAPAPFTSAVTWTGEGEGGGGATTPAAPNLLQRLKLKKSQAAAGAATSGTGKCKAGAISTPTPRLLRGIAAAVAQLAFGPHLRAVSRVCSATQSLIAATSLHEFSSILSCTVSEALAAELHINLNVWVVIVPPLHAQYGYLLPLDSPNTAAAVSASIAELGLNRTTPVKRAVSGILSGTTSSISGRSPRNNGRAGSFSGQAPQSSPNALTSAPGGILGKADSGRAMPFSLPSSMLLQLLRPGAGSRLGNGSVHAGASSGKGILSYNPEEPTVRSIVTTAKASAVDPAGYTTATGSTGCSGAGPQRVGVGVTSGGPPSVGAGAVSGMVVANLHAWMQDVERPSSDVALLMMAARGRGVPGGAAPGRPSQGGAGGAALGVGPACLVALAGCALPRPTAANLPAAASGSIHAGTAVSKLTNPVDDAWVRSLDSSQRRGCGVAVGGLAADLASFRGGQGHWYGSGNVRFDSGGLNYNPCVALYLTAQERLPTSLLRAVKDRAAGLLEMLLPACLCSLQAGPLRIEADLLAAASVGGAGTTTPGGGGGGGGGSFIGPNTRQILVAVGSNSGTVTPGAVATPSISASVTPLPSTHISGSQVQFSQLQLQMQMLAAGRASAGAVCSSPRRGGLGIGAEEAVSMRSPLGAAATQTASISAVAAVSSGAVSPMRLPQVAGTPRSAAGGNATTSSLEAGCGGARGAGGSDGGGTGRLIPILGLCRDLTLIDQQRWPDAEGAGGGGGGGGPGPAANEGAGRGNSPCAPPAVTPATIASSQSRTTRGSPGSCGFRAGVEESSLMASMDVTGAMDDVSSMRDNLDVWVHSFWEMLRDAPPNKSGHTHGSYADDDLRYLRLYQRLGSGGAASVYAGVLLGMDVAVKVIEPPPHVDVEALASTQPLGPSGSLGEATAKAAAGAGPEGQGVEETEEGRMAELAAAVRQAQMRELVRSARECAVLTTVSHPAIVQVYSYHTRVQVVPGEGPDGLPRLVPVPPGEGNEAQGPLHSVLVMERCDLGSLADALDNGMFKKAIIAAANNSGPLSASPPTVPRSPGGGVRHQLSGGPTSSNSGGGSPGFTFATSHGGGGGGGGSAMRAIYLTLLEVALALRHLHSMNLVHCDVKVANVLLKSSSSDPRGFTCKLSDFGLVNLLRSEEESPEQEQEQEQEQGSDGNGRAGGAASRRQGEAEGRRPVTGGWEGCKPWMRNADAAGTVTHLAPECFEPDRKLDQSVDIYAFGIVMWEVLTRQPPYAEFAPDFEGLPARVIEGLRPRFPTHCPAAYRALAQGCWCRDPARRPTAAAVVNCLQHLLEGGNL